MPGEDRPNRVELEYGARVNRPEFDAAEAEVEQRAAKTTTRADRAAEHRRIAKPDSALSEENLARRERLADEAFVKEQKLAERAAAAQAASVVSLQRQRSAALVAEFNQREKLRLADERAAEKASENELARINRNAEARRRLFIRQQVENKAEGEGASLANALGGASNRLNGNPYEHGKIPGIGTALGFAGAQVGLPGLGSVASATTIGGVAALLAGVTVLGLGFSKLIGLQQDAEKSQLDLAVASRDTGTTLAEASQSTDAFRESMVVNRLEAQKLAAAYGELTLKTGGVLNANAPAALSRLATARGLDADKTGAALSGLAKGDAGAFESLTGQRADLTLDRYAKSIGTTVSRLTEMQKAQALTTEAVRRSADVSDIAEKRAHALESRFASFKNGLVDFASSFASALDAAGNNESYEQTYKRTLLGVGADKSSAEYNAEVMAANKRKADETEVNRQQSVRQQQADRLEKLARDAKGIGENDSLGLSATQRSLVELNRAREQRAALQAEAEAFQKIKSQFSSDDADKFEKEFVDKIQAATDAVRSKVEAMVTAASAKVYALSRDIRDSGEEFTRLRLGGDSQNPYVKLFNDAETAAAKAQERFGLLGEAAVEAYAKASRAAIDTQRYQLRVTDAMSATKLEFEAAQLSKPFIELTGEMKRTLTVFNEELKLATSAPGLSARADLVERTRSQRDRFGSIFRNPEDTFNTGNPNFQNKTTRINAQGNLEVNPDRVARQEYDRLIALMTKYQAAPGLGGEQLRNQLNQALSGLYESLSPGARREVAGNATVRDRFASAYRGQVTFQESQIDLAAQRAEATRAPLQLAERQLRELSNVSQGGANDEAVRNRTRQEFLSITGAVPREELTPELVKGRVDALREEAAFQRAREKQADDATKATVAFQKTLIGDGKTGGVLGEMLKAIQARNERVTVEVLDRTDNAKISTLGKGFGG